MWERLLSTGAKIRVLFFKKQEGITLFKALYIQMVINHEHKPMCSCEMLDLLYIYLE